MENGKGTDSRWLKTLAASEVDKPKTWSQDELKEISGSRKAKSRIQEILQNFYYELENRLKGHMIDGEVTVDEDLFDGWYSEVGIDDYQGKYNLMQSFNAIAGAIQVDIASDYQQQNFDELFSKIAQRCIDEPEYLEKVKQAINDKYTGLIGEFKYEPSATELNRHEEQEYNKRIQQIERRIESNVDDYTELLQKIEAAKKTNFEKIADQLNKVVIWGTAAWELILYGVMSVYSPRIFINNLDRRSNIHCILAGDISTAKSGVLKVCKFIAPKSVIMDDSSKATFEGIANRGGIEEGVLDWAKDGIILVEELSTKLTRMKLFRRAMDCEDYAVHKGGSSKVRPVNTTMIAACNPDEDFFQEETSFRSQIPYKEGILSRFDVLIPLTSTPEQNDMILDEMTLFEEGQTFSFADIKSQLHTLSVGMKNIKRVSLTLEQSDKLKEAFRLHNNRDQKSNVLKFRPLVILRDLETLARFVNTIATVNFSKRTIDDEGTLLVDDSDIEKGIQLWENLLSYRIQLYSDKPARNLMSISDEMVLYLFSNDAVSNEIAVSQLFNEFVSVRRMLAKSTFYKELDTLIETGRIVALGERNRTVKLVIR